MNKKKIFSAFALSLALFVTANVTTGCELPEPRTYTLELYDDDGQKVLKRYEGVTSYYEEEDGEVEFITSDGREREWDGPYNAILEPLAQ